MKKVFQKLFSLLKKTSPSRKRNARKPKGQSFLEFALLLPILIMLFTGMIEFGFMLNEYLSLLDATRSAARLCSNKTPFKLDTSTDPDTIIDDLTFYPYCAGVVVSTLDPSLAIPPDPLARRIIMNSDPGNDDVIVSVLRVSVDNVTNPAAPTIILPIERFPDGYDFYSEYLNQLSGYTDTDIENLMTQNGALPVESGILIVEVYYGYKGILKLPWVEAFMSDNNPVMLHATTIMPLVAAKP